MTLWWHRPFFMVWSAWAAASLLQKETMGVCVYVCVCIHIYTQLYSVYTSILIIFRIYTVFQVGLYGVYTIFFVFILVSDFVYCLL